MHTCVTFCVSTFSVHVYGTKKWHYTSKKTFLNMFTAVLFWILKWQHHTFYYAINERYFLYQMLRFQILNQDISAINNFIFWIMYNSLWHIFVLLYVNKIWNDLKYGWEQLVFSFDGELMLKAILNVYNCLIYCSNSSLLLLRHIIFTKN